MTGHGQAADPKPEKKPGSMDAPDGAIGRKPKASCHSQVGKLRPGQGRTLTLEKSKALNQLQRRNVFPVHKTMKKRKKVYVNLPERREERCPHPTCLSRAGSFQDSARS